LVENRDAVRAAVGGGLGVRVVVRVAAANEQGEPERRVTAAQSRVTAYVVPTNEELEIARACLAVLDGGRPV
jgi:acetate kinase